MKKSITLIVFAAHHTSGNVASQRFRGLIKYMNHDDLDVIVISRKGKYSSNSEWYRIIEVPGTAYDSKSNPLHLLILGVSLKLPKFAFLLGKYVKKIWAINAAVTARKLVCSEMAVGRHCIVLGTFCPLDSLVAASCVARETGSNLVQDFRDGLGFEPIGRQGKFVMVVKGWFEYESSKRAKALLSVSDPIALHLRKKFPLIHVEIIPNGYDPEEFVASDPKVVRLCDRYFRRYVNENEILVGHFGRISLSDPSSWLALQRLVNDLQQLDYSRRNRFRFIFMGELSDEEKALLSTTSLHFSLLKPRQREIAIEFMRRMRFLLLVTGSRKSVVTGKIFDYLAVKGRVIQYTSVLNEASAILNNDVASHFIYGSSQVSKISETPEWEENEIVAHNNTEVEQRFNRVSQANVLLRLLKEISCCSAEKHFY